MEEFWNKWENTWSISFGAIIEAASSRLTLLLSEATLRCYLVSMRACIASSLVIFPSKQSWLCICTHEEAARNGFWNSGRSLEQTSPARRTTIWMIGLCHVSDLKAKRFIEKHESSTHLLLPKTSGCVCHVAVLFRCHRILEMTTLALKSWRKVMLYLHPCRLHGPFLFLNPKVKSPSPHWSKIRCGHYYLQAGDQHKGWQNAETWRGR